MFLKETIRNLSYLVSEINLKGFTELHTYTDLMAFRFEKEDEMSPLRPLKDISL